MEKTPKALRTHISFFGKRNVGKSSLVNKLANQKVSIVSDTAGTTTDPVEKTMELLPFGPVVLIDTAGIDDVGELGLKRIEKTNEIIDRTDIAIIVCDSTCWSEHEKNLFNKLNNKKIPVIALVNKTDVSQPDLQKLNEIQKYTKNIICISAITEKNLAEKLLKLISNILPENFAREQHIVSDLIPEKSVVVLVVPIDKEAPKGRLILPQVQTLRELLDNNFKTLVVKDSELEESLQLLKTKPSLIITDSQAFKKVSKIVPEDIYLTSFSILFARMKGDLKTFFEGSLSIDKLNNNDKVLICESCTHHSIEDDIAKVKIPKLINKHTNKTIIFDFYSSHDFAKDIGDYKLIIHCGGCMTTKQEIISRIEKCKDANVPITNYGMAIAHCLGILPRAMQLFN